MHTASHALREHRATDSQWLERRHGVVPTTAGGWSNCAATSSTWHWSTSGCTATRARLVLPSDSAEPVEAAQPAAREPN